MPFVEDKNEQLLERKMIALPEMEGAEESMIDLAMATFRTENSIGSLISRSSIDNLPDRKVDNEDFNPFIHMTEGEQLDERFVSNAALADSIQELDAVRKLTAKERNDRGTLANGGAMSFALGFGIGGIGDPINLIPIGGTALKTYKTGHSILKSGMVIGGVSAASTSIQESALHATQIERTMGESALNVSASFLLGGVLGMGVKKLGTLGVTQKTFDEIDDVMNVEVKRRAGGESTGAQKVDSDVQVKGSKLRAVLRKTAFDPLTRSMVSDSPPTRKWANALAENVYDVDGKTTASVETMAKMWDGRYATALEGHLDDLTSYRKELGVNSKKDILLRKGITRKAFNESVTKQFRNPDPSAPKAIKSAAERWEREVYAPLRKEMISAKLLGEEVTSSTALNYVNRIWNKQKLSAKMPDFIKTTARWLKEQDVDGKKLDNEEYDFAAREIALRISGTPDGRLPYDWKIGEGSKNFGVSGTKLKGAFQEKTFNIPDKLVEDFLENDIELVAGRYFKQVAPDIELAKRFDGDVGMEVQIKEIQQWWAGEIESAKTPKERIKLTKSMEDDIRDIAGMRDRIRGVYGTPEEQNSVFTRVLRTTRDLNYMRLLGGVVPSSIPDTARIFMAEGFVKAFKNGLIPLIKNTKQFKIAASEAKRYNGVLSAAMGGRGDMIADVADYTAGGTVVERALRSGAENFGKINLLDYWTAGMKQVHAVTMQTSIFDSLAKGEFDKRLARLGIDEESAKQMLKQAKKHGGKKGGVWVTGAKNWDNPDLEMMWGAAMRKESDRVIQMVGQEKPLFMSREMGKSVMQFKSFMLSATQKMLIAGIQGQDHNYIGGTLASITLGMTAYAFKNWDAGRELSDNPADWVMEGIDRSGSLGAIMEINNTVEKMTAGRFSVRRAVGAKSFASKYASRNLSETLLGPTFGSFLSTTTNVMGSAAQDKDWTESDTRALRRLIPYQNLMIFRQAVDKIEGKK